MTDEELIELEPEILKACQEFVLQRDHLARLIVKKRWPDKLDAHFTFEPAPANSGNGGVTHSTRTYGLKHAAVHGPLICMYEPLDKRFVEYSMRDAAYWMWSQFFRNELLMLIQHRLLVRNLPDVKMLGLTRIVSANTKRINIFGKSVQQFIVQKSKIGAKYVLNRKYKRAAEQVIFFHPGIAHFQFLNPEQWIGQLSWKNIPDIETNPDGNIGFYRLVTTAAVKPMMPDLGLVVTVVPRGIRGFFYYWIWKLFRFVP